MTKTPNGRLAFADGTIFRGTAFGAVGKGLVAAAEVVFNTAMTGYQESMTDPSYTGQILVQTATMIGNTGTNPVDTESDRVQIAGLVVREAARLHSNYRADRSLAEYLAANNTLALAGVDTRAITRRLRAEGSLSGALTDDDTVSDVELVRRAASTPSMAGANLVPHVGRHDSGMWSGSTGDWTPASVAQPGETLRVLALDCGAKHNILRSLVDRGCAVEVIPHDTPASDILRRFETGEADGLFVSNGPGDPAAVERTIDTLRSLMQADRPIPTFGICLGHQLLSLACGAETFKLKFGHRGANQPVRNALTGDIEITSQNHGFAVTPESVEAAGGEVTHTNLNDGTVAGFRLTTKPVFAVQHHPEASPGPHDAGYLFDAFVRMMRSGKPEPVNA